MVHNDANTTSLITEPTFKGFILFLSDFIHGKSKAWMIPCANPITSARMVGRNAEERYQGDNTTTREGLARFFLIFSILQLVAYHSSSEIHLSALIFRVYPSSAQFHSVPIAWRRRRIDITHARHQHMYRLGIILLGDNPQRFHSNAR